MEYNKRNHKYMVIQYGYACFGIGRTQCTAMIDAAKNLEFDYTSKPSVRDVRRLLDQADGNYPYCPVGGEFYLVPVSDDNVDYIKNL